MIIAIITIISSMMKSWSICISFSRWYISCISIIFHEILSIFNIIIFVLSDDNLSYYDNIHNNDYSSNYNNHIIYDEVDEFVFLSLDDISHAYQSYFMKFYPYLTLYLCYLMIIYHIITIIYIIIMIIAAIITIISSMMTLISLYFFL